MCPRTLRGPPEHAHGARVASALHARDAAPSGIISAALIGKQDDWEALGLEKRTDYENLRRVFERICGAKRTHFDAKDLANAFKYVAQSTHFAGDCSTSAVNTH